MLKSDPNTIFKATLFKWKYQSKSNKLNWYLGFKFKVQFFASINTKSISKNKKFIFNLFWLLDIHIGEGQSVHILSPHNHRIPSNSFDLQTSEIIIPASQFLPSRLGFFFRIQIMILLQSLLSVYYLLKIHPLIITYS